MGVLISGCAYKAIPVPTPEEGNSAPHSNDGDSDFKRAEREAREVLERYKENLRILDVTSAIQDGLDITTGGIGVGLAVLNTGPVNGKDSSGENWFSRNLGFIAFATGVVHLAHYIMGGEGRARIYGNAAAVTECVIGATRPSEERTRVAKKALSKMKKPGGKELQLSDRMKDYLRVELATQYDDRRAAALLRSAVAKIQASVTAQTSRAELGEAKSVEMASPLDTLAERRVERCLTRLLVSVGH